LYDTIQECGSDVRFNWSEEYLSWNCKTEPVICPPHGYQTQICVAWSQKENQEIKRENQISCSPGICAGCMTPRWLGGNENKCIPYGFRFMQKAQWEWGLIKEIVDQDPLSVAGALNEEDLGLEVYPNQTALLYVGDWNATFYLQIGAIIDITPYLDKYFGENIESTMTVDEILYDSVDYNNSKIIVTFTFREYGSKIVVPEINLYCDIDGWVKQQKTKEGSEWAKCQNNYECESNICSYGECVDLKGIVEQANVFKGTFIKVVCKLSNLFDIDDYSQCVWKYLGEEVSTTASSGGGSGGGSSGGSSPPSMPN
jgi:hypothetical protein